MTQLATRATDLQLLRRMMRTPAGGARRRVELGGLVVNFHDLPSLYTAWKNIFCRRIYHFETALERPFIVDGGAWIGLSAMYFKRACPGARILCFEPDETALRLLHGNIAANDLHDVQVIAAALSDRTGAAPFVPDGADGGRLLRSARQERPEAGAGPAAQTRTVRLSEHLSEPVECLKLNIEGQELAVLSDLEASGKLALVHRIVLEYHGWPQDRQDLGDILGLLDRGGFRYLLHDFDRETNPATKPPFRIRRTVPWFCLVYAERPGPARPKPASLRAGRARTDPAAAPSPPPGSIDWGDLRRTAPVSRVFGLDRGTPVDRHYIEKFLAGHAADIRGRVLEVGDSTYTRRFGADRVTGSEVLHAEAGNRHATMVGDLATGRGIPPQAFDCIILTQTLHCIEDVRSAIANCAAALAPGGVLLATVPGISQISRYDMQRWGDYWRFTTLSIRRLFAPVFGAVNVDVAAHGNVLAASAFLQGLAAEELTPRELDQADEDYELLITIRAVRQKAA